MPGQTPRRAGPGQSLRSTCFNGGPGNCPAKPRGRGGPHIMVRRRFNGGPGNCPAKPAMTAATAARDSLLQWRAGQLPGQTPTRPARASPAPTSLQWRAGQLPGQTLGPNRHARIDRRASMEGRAIARPNPAPGGLGRLVPGCFNGGPGNCPAKPQDEYDALLGDLVASMEGRAIARPNRDMGQLHHDSVVVASMEGRAIARPNRQRV